MAIFTCLAMFLAGKKKKNMRSGDGEFHIKTNNISSSSTKDGIQGLHFAASESFSALEERSSLVPNVPSNDRLARAESAGDVTYERGDEHDEIQSMKRDYSDFDLQGNGEFGSHGSNFKMQTNEGITPGTTMFARGHVSDPGMEQSVCLASLVLKRSCSNIEIKRAYKSLNSSKSFHSCSELKNLSRNCIGQFTYETHSSPLSVKTSCSADYVILKKRSSCQVLPSRCRKIWWKFFLWSHTNLRKPNAPQKLAFALTNANQKFGYSSDTHELVQKLDKPKKSLESNNQWFAFSLQSSSPQDRVYDWVNSIDDRIFCPIDDEETCSGKEDEWTAGPRYMEIGESSWKNHSQTTLCAEEEVNQAKNIIQSLKNSFSSVAHISGMGLKVIPSISAFGNLRSVSLSGNSIAHITPGCLPKHIHSLDLSRNKISAIEGLRDLTRLRVLNLSYNRISRIGHGLSNCTVIKELNLAGNKISDVEGLHRLLKLTGLDLSFNKITTTKAFGQLVANYNSLLSLNLIGNSIQSNLGEDQIRKAVLSILPRLSYFNKQPIKHRVREVGANMVATTAIGDGRWSSQRRPMRRLAQGLGSTTKSKIREGSPKGRKNQSMKLQVEFYD
ncbi:uncharacterized protein LOC110092251 isoform X2 [Dendrobium catenatum]|uniref:uncharacterized protein LOC110092251 isoform X2 n=1 Tax=Dendrobium catenatum TaxID=906689 RepID=UPI00109F6C59|nr:uncharacterized protein LOC110092251 isoform X2 [Dendrobium catenatum]